MTQLCVSSSKGLCWKEWAKILKKAIHYFPAKVDYSSTDTDIYRMHFIIGTDLEINGSFSVSTRSPLPSPWYVQLTQSIDPFLFSLLTFQYCII